MGKSAAFKVPFSGLKTGEHTFEFIADNSFFEKFEYAQIEKGEVQIALKLAKKPTHMELNFTLKGSIDENCDRCTVAYQQPIIGAYTIYVKFGDDFDEPDDNLLIIPREAFEIDVSHMIYEFIELSIPRKLVPCDESGDTSICNQEILQRLESNISEEKKSNPLWNALNEIKDQLKEK
ncbi:MAG: DUF177 domain-containing protein [Flavobacteriales bacterium]|nr:DUF177 domain-containing protein [Flavobacteriales bacterium]